MPTGPNPVFDAANLFLPATTAMSSDTQTVFSSLPLGLNDGGELGLKVVLIGSSVDTTGTISVTASERQYTTASTAAPVTANGDAFTLTAGQSGFVQNLDDEPLFVKLGTGASAASFNYVLKAGTAADDGTGGSVQINNWVGIVSIFATGTARASAFKLS
jgi:hypothetical protein